MKIDMTKVVSVGKKIGAFALPIAIGVGQMLVQKKEIDAAVAKEVAKQTLTKAGES